MLQESLTEQQQRIFNYIQSLIENRGFGPSIREIADKMGFKSPNGVVCHLKALEKKGLITRTAKHSRSIVLTEAANEETRGLPLAGRVAAGSLTQANEQTERIDLASLFTRKGTFLLEVSGDSMIDAAIADGDLVVVEKRQNASEGDIVVALNGDGEATLKYWYPEKNRIRLQPANKNLKPIYVKDAKVTGVVVGVIRRINR